MQVKKLLYLLFLLSLTIFLLILQLQCVPPNGGDNGGNGKKSSSSSSTSLCYEALDNNVEKNISRFNGKKIYSIIAPMPSTKPESNSAPSTTYPYSLFTNLSSATQVTLGNWTVGNISERGGKLYYFNATAGQQYNIRWDDSYQGSGSYTCDIVVSAYRENFSTSYFTDVDSGYSTPKVITASATEKVYIYVKGYDLTESGTYAIRVGSGTSGDIIAPAIIDKGSKVVEINDNFFSDVKFNEEKDSPYSKEQRELDTFLRNKENEVLGSKALQLPEYYAKAGIVKAPPYPINVGTTWNNVYIVLTGTTISTTCRYISNTAYFFVDNRDYPSPISDSLLASYGSAFDTIHGINNTKFGSENDTDGNGKVIIVFSRELSGGLLGYFYAIDKYPKSTYPNSNEGDIFYVTSESTYQGNIIKGTLAHEHQHMIYFDQHYNRGVTSTYSWLNEALSQAAEYYTGYTDNHLAWIRNYLKSWAGLSLTHWTSSNYGYGAIFIRYLIDRFGDTAIKNMCSTDKVGIAAVEAATGVDFNELFNDFTRAIVMSGTGDSSDPKYNFKTLDLKAVQPEGRGGLLPGGLFVSGYCAINFSGFYAYRIWFLEWTGTFGTMQLRSSSVKGTAFGLSR